MLKRKSLPIIILSAILMIATVPSCSWYPDSEARIEDLDIVVTRFDEGNDFSLNHTYSLVDEVVEVDDDTTDTPDPIDNSDLIIAQIDANMQALGYEKVDDNADPDLRIAATASSTTNWYYYYYYDYWYWYGGGWYGWGGWWGYPCCYYYPPAYPVVESYTTGTLVMQMAQTRDVAPGDTVNMVWTGVINGLLDDTQSNIRLRIKSTIDEAFKQSPYLDVNPQ